MECRLTPSHDTENADEEQSAPMRIQRKTASFHFYPVISNDDVWLAAYRYGYLTTMQILHEIVFILMC